MPELLAACHHRCAARGGHGAFRDFAEWLLGLRAESPAGPESPEPPEPLRSPEPLKKEER